MILTCDIDNQYCNNIDIIFFIFDLIIVSWPNCAVVYCPSIGTEDLKGEVV